MVLELLGLAAIPTAVGVGEAVHQQHIEDEARAAPFNLVVYCAEKSRKRSSVDGASVCVRDNKLFLKSKDQSWSETPSSTLPFRGFFRNFPERNGRTMGLVGTVPSESERPKLNWIYVDSKTLEVKYGPRVLAREGLYGPWDWTEDEEGLMLEGWEGFVAVEENEDDEESWAIYFDRYDDRLKGKVKGKRVLTCSLERKLVVEESDSLEKR